jgi:3-oxoacyl-[acyl-carrier-protein] synthase II
MNNVCITGVGLVSSLGHTPDKLFGNLKKNKCFFQEEPSWKELIGLNTHVSSPAQNYEVSDLPRQVRRSMSPMSKMGYLAAHNALKDAGLTVNRNVNSNSDLYKTDSLKTLLMMGSTTGSPIFLEEYFTKMIKNGGPAGQLSTSFLKIMNHSVSANVALALGYSGPSISPSSACSTSAQAAIIAMQFIRAGIYDVAIVGGADELHSTSASVFDIARASSCNYNDRPQEIPGPFSKDRDGLVVSEGSGVLILESEEHVNKRGGKVYAQILGGQYMCDGIHMTQPQSCQMAITMEQTLKDANVSKKDIGYVNAHATGTKVGDYEEAKAINSVFGARNVPVSSLKGHLGHSLSACGAIEIISIIEMMKNKMLIGNRNVTEVLDGFPGIDILKSNKQLELSYAISNNFAFGGMNTSLVLKNLM